MKKDFIEIEKIIANRIEELEKDWDLDSADIRDIRMETYKENGWNYDPFPQEEEEEEPWDQESCSGLTYNDMRCDAGMGYWAFF